jgi:SAM-dependent methyltransferase
MVARFEARAQAEGLTQAAGRVMDAHQLELEDDLFDLTGSQFGVMLVPDQSIALREMVRVTKPGGRVLLVAYGALTDFEALQFFVAALKSVRSDFEGVPDDPPPLEFQVSDPDVMAERLAAAGLRDVRVDTAHQERLELRSGLECWNWMVNSNPIVGAILSEFSHGEQAGARHRLDELIRERRGNASWAVLTAPLNLGLGWK